MSEGATPSPALERLRVALHTGLEGRASELLLRRLDVVLEEGWGAGADHEGCLQRIRLAVRMFVDESLADELIVALRRAILG